MRCHKVSIPSNRGNPSDILFRDGSEIWKESQSPQIGAILLTGTFLLHKISDSYNRILTDLFKKAVR